MLRRKEILRKRKNALHSLVLRARKRKAEEKGLEERRDMSEGGES